jgi:hypothetical protein
MRRTLALLLAALSLGGAVACGEEDVQQGVEDAAQEAKEAGRDVQKAGEDAAQEAKEAGRDVQKTGEDAVNEAEDAARDVGDGK